MKNREGFTLIEIMVVVVIIALLASVGIGAYMQHLKRARIEITRATIREAADSVEMYKMQKAKYPDTLNEVLAAEMLKEIPRDAWGNPLIYHKGGGSGRKFEIGSYGGDGQSGGQDEDADLWSYDTPTNK